ncbi:MAG: PA2169 family four-helix-bundle protein [Sphingobacteriaceae bacterium]|nr:MAG: PA2169 family four-helix-bundle protein [Sphingobacteriaceae bacterium]
MGDTQATIDMLNDLVQINNDRAKGFEQALEGLGDDDAHIKATFLTCINQSHRFKMELGTEIEALSKHQDINNTGTLLGALHRSWLELKSNFTAFNTKSVLEECEFGEDAILKMYAVVLDQDYMPAYIRDILLMQQDTLQQAHDEIKLLRDQV